MIQRADRSAAVVNGICSVIALTCRCWKISAIRSWSAASTARTTISPGSVRAVYAALEATPYEEVSVLLLGQDPYPTPGHAHGLCFSVLPGVKPPASLRNIYKELNDDLGVPVASTGL